MKPLYLFIISLSFPFLLQAQGSKPLEVTAGNLSSLLTDEEKGNITSLTLSGTIDANDISVIQFELPALTDLDLSLTTVSACSITGVFDFPANWFPGPSIGKNSLNYGGLNKPLLTSLKLPSQLEVLGSEALSNCSGLTSLVIPPTVKTIGWSAFEFCSGLTSLDIPSSVTHLDQYAFRYCTGLKEVTIPSSITYLPRGAFQHCSELTSVTIPSSVTTIDDDAFMDCIALNTLILPSSSLSIGNLTFWRCNNLTSIYSYSPIPPINSDSFDETIKTTCFIYVPFGSKVLYEAAEGWRDFKNIEEMPGLSLSANAITIASQNESTGTVLLSSNASWTAGSDQSWLTVSPVTGNGNETLTFTAEKNNTGVARTAIVSVSWSDAEPQTVIVTQEVTQPNQAPVARAGNEQTINEGATVTLDGSASSDADNDELTYLWTAPEGIELSSSTSVSPTFTAPEVDTDTDYTFILVVNDGTTNSTTDKVVIHVMRKNNAPVANAGIDLFVHEEVILTLDGSNSFDPDNDELTYQWTAPEGIELSGTGAYPTFTAPEVSTDKEYTFSLIVSDGKDISLVDRVTVTVLNSNISQHFSAVRMGTENEQMIFFVSMARINGMDLQEGDEIAIFDGLTCVGAATVRQVLNGNNSLCIKVYLDNPATLMKDGFIPGHTPVVRIWNSVTNKDVILQVFDYEPGSSQVFETKGIAIISVDAVVTGMDDLLEGTDVLGNNYPNPFNSHTVIPYVLAGKTTVDISIFDLAGRKVTTLVHDHLQPGEYTVTLDKNAGIKPGTYICKMQTDNLILTKLIVAQ